MESYDSNVDIAKLGSDYVLFNTDGSQEINNKGSNDNLSQVVNETEVKKYGDFINFEEGEHTLEQIKKTLKHGIIANGMKILRAKDCDWYYDYYQATKSSHPPIKEFTENTTVDYYYYTTPYDTQFGKINLVMVQGQVNFGDNTFTPTDKYFDEKKITPEMIKRAKIAAQKMKK